MRGTVDSIGRKIMAGDVIELPHQKDEYALVESLVALKRFYVISEVTRPASGYSQTWYPHLIRCKCAPLVDTQEFKEILDQESGAEDGTTIRDLLSMQQKALEVNEQIIAQALADTGKSGYDTEHLYVVPKLKDGLVDVADTSNTEDDASIDNPSLDASIVLNSPTKNYYVGH